MAEHAATVRCLNQMTGIRAPTGLGVVVGVKGFMSKWTIEVFLVIIVLSPIPQRAKALMPAHVKLWGDCCQAVIALLPFTCRNVTQEVLPMIMPFDLIAHIFHVSLM